MNSIKSADYRMNKVKFVFIVNMAGVFVCVLIQYVCMYILYMYFILSRSGFSIKFGGGGHNRLGPGGYGIPRKQGGWSRGPPPEKCVHIHIL